MPYLLVCYAGVYCHVLFAHVIVLYLVMGYVILLLSVANNNGIYLGLCLLICVAIKCWYCW